MFGLSHYVDRNDFELTINQDTSWSTYLIEKLDMDMHYILEKCTQYGTSLPDNFEEYSWTNKPLSRSINEKHMSISNTSGNKKVSIQQNRQLKSFSMMDGYSSSSLSSGIRFWIEEDEIDKYVDKSEEISI